MTPSQLFRAKDRFPQLIQLLQQRSLSGALISDALAPNRMTVSRWSRGLQDPSEEQLTAIIDWAATKLGDQIKTIYDKSEKHWAETLGVTGDLRVLRKSLGLKQAEVALAIGVSRYTYLCVERLVLHTETSQALADRAREWLTQKQAEATRNKQTTDGAAD